MRPAGALPPFPRDLVRADLQDFTGYSSARVSAPGATAAPTRVWLNANEAAGPSGADPGGASRRYPDPQPADLVAALARLCSSPPERVVVGRGSDELIELVVRSVCRPGQDGVVVAPPTFGMYAVSARLHGVPVTEVPQRDDGDRWVVDTDALAAAALGSGARVIFVATPGNPTGSVVPLADLAALAAAVAGRALVVVDEAYGEFTEAPSAASLLEDHPHVVVLRTLSKAHALAGARVGLALAHPDLATVLRRVQAPYPVPVPVRDLALAALTPPALEETRRRVGETLRLRAETGQFLRSLPGVRAVYVSEANFHLVRVDDPPLMLRLLDEAGITVRDLRAQTRLEDALRITVGSAAEMAALHRALTDPRPGPTTVPSTPAPVEETPA